MSKEKIHKATGFLRQAEKHSIKAAENIRHARKLVAGRFISVKEASDLAVKLGMKLSQAQGRLKRSGTIKKISKG